MSGEQDQVEGLLLKAGRSFDAAESLLHDGYADFAVSRAYYGTDSATPLAARRKAARS